MESGPAPRLPVPDALHVCGRSYVYAWHGSTGTAYMPGYTPKFSSVPPVA